MNRKGFTLIELLAVIVILAIIALIATPIILNMINNARKSSAKSSALGYIDAIEYNNGFAQIQPDKYTLVTGEDINVSNINVKAKGKKPDSGKVTVNDKGKVTSAELCINGYKAIYDGKDVTNVTKGCSESSNNQEPTPSVPDPVSFSSDSWATIAANTTSNKYEVGNEKTINMDVDEDGNDETYHIMIVNKTECTTETSESACGLVLQFKELLKTKTDDDKKMNLSNTNVGGWPASKMYTYLNTTIYGKLPTELKNVIKTTKTVSGHGQNDNNDENYISYDKLYLLSPTEIGFNTSNASVDSSYQETRKLDYYTDYNDHSTRIKYAYGTSAASRWWLRAPYSSRTTSFMFVNTSGAADDGSDRATVMNGVIPAFRIGVN